MMEKPQGEDEQHVPEAHKRSPPSPWEPGLLSQRASPQHPGPPPASAFPPKRTDGRGRHNPEVAGLLLSGVDHRRPRQRSSR